MSLLALLASSTVSVYKYFKQRTLNLVRVPVFLIFTLLASLRRAVRRKSLISLICLGCGAEREGEGDTRTGQEPVSGRKARRARDGGAAERLSARMTKRRREDEKTPRK